MNVVTDQEINEIAELVYASETKCVLHHDLISPESKCTTLFADIHFHMFQCWVPNAYPLANISENMIDFTKALKELACLYLQFVPVDYYSAGKTMIKQEDIPGEVRM